jgi:MarR family transcriptional regulator for hemolysin
MNDISQNSAVPLLTGLVRAIRDCCQQKEGMLCKKLGVTRSQFACLVALPEPAAELNVQQVSTAMGLSPSRACRVVDSLVRRGLLLRRAMDSDRRIQLVALTATGRKKWQQAQKLLAECEEKLREHLPAGRPQELAKTLKTLIDAW